MCARFASVSAGSDETVSGAVMRTVKSLTTNRKEEKIDTSFRNEGKRT